MKTKEFLIERDKYVNQLEGEIVDKVFKIQELESQLKEVEGLKDQIIEAFRAGRKAGAIFKTQRDAEGLAERYLRDLTIKLNPDKK